ncbi:hypothetical protein ACPCAE_11575 [Streptomyces cinereoruber]|uniref:hypothetical protein n=1 Tax=Streptomyces cinereoruber TaxID=67260 RepID=UPI003C2AC594
MVDGAIVLSSYWEWMIGTNLAEVARSNPYVNLGTYVYAGKGGVSLVACEPMRTHLKDEEKMCPVPLGRRTVPQGKVVA